MNWAKKIKRPRTEGIGWFVPTIRHYHTINNPKRIETYISRYFKKRCHRFLVKRHSQPIVEVI